MTEEEERARSLGPRVSVNVELELGEWNDAGAE